MTNQKAVVVAGMAFGDEAKGATVDFLCRDLNAKLVVRYNGGHQCAHNVITSDGRHHTFSQFGSGSFIPGVLTHLSRFMLVSPFSMRLEAEHLEKVGITDIWDRTTVDENCVIVTPYHRAFNRLQEIHRGHRAHGSCGVGIGVTRQLELAGLALRVKDIHIGNDMQRILWEIKTALENKLGDFRYDLEETPEVVQELEVFEYDDTHTLRRDYLDWAETAMIVPEFIPADVMIFEGAQGVLLDETHGTAPHNTWTNTTFHNALTLLFEAGFQGEVTKLGCWRSYFTRHGAGPFPTENKHLDQPFYSHLEAHNTTGRFQGAWRVGEFDFGLASSATRIVGGIDEIAVSHMDVVELDLEKLSHYVKAPVTILGFGPTADDRVRQPNPQSSLPANSLTINSN